MDQSGTLPTYSLLDQAARESNVRDLGKASDKEQLEVYRLAVEKIRYLLYNIDFEIVTTALLILLESDLRRIVGGFNGVRNKTGNLIRSPASVLKNMNRAYSTLSVAKVTLREIEETVEKNPRNTAIRRKSCYDALTGCRTALDDVISYW